MVDPSTGPPDLAHAIQVMLRDSEPPKKTRLLLDEERVVLKGCADMLEQLQDTRDQLRDVKTWHKLAKESAERRLVELQATRDRLADLESAIDWQTSCTACAKVLDASTAYHERAERERADLQVYAAELHDLLQQVVELHGGPEGAALWVTQPFGQKIGVALQADPPARGRAILEEVERLRTVREALRKVDEHPYDMEAAADLDEALQEFDALDLGATQEEDGG